MKKNYFKKSLSLVLTVLMLMSCWVFVAPTEAEAANIDISYPLTIQFDVTDDLANGGHILVDYYKINDNGTVDTSTSYRYTLINSLKSEGYSGVKNDYQVSANIPGWPYSVTISVANNNVDTDKLALNWIKIGNRYVFNDNWTVQDNQTVTFAYNNSQGSWSGSTAWFTPSWAVNSALGGATLQVPTYGTRTSGTLSASFYDSNYGVAWPQNYVSYSINGSNVNLSSTSGSSTTVSVTSAATSNFTNATGTAYLTLTASGAGKTSTSTITLNAPKKEILYENLFSLSDWYYSDSSKWNDGNVKTNVDAGTITITNPTTDSSTEYTTNATTGAHPSNYYSIPVTAGKTYYFVCDTANATSTEVFFMYKDQNGTGLSYPSVYFNGNGKQVAQFTAPTYATSAEIRFDNNTDGTTATFSNIGVYEKTRADEVDLINWTTRPVRKVYTYNTSSAASAGLDQPARIGYTFSGWTNANGSAYTAQTMNTTRTVYSTWTANNYTLTFEGNGGNASSGSLNYKISDTFTLPSATRDSHIFNSWKVTKADGNWVADKTYAANSSLTGMYGNATLTAQWTKLLEVKFVNEDGTVLKTEYVAPGASATPPNAPTKNPTAECEYKFSKWDKSYDNITADTTIKAVFSEVAHDLRYIIEENATCDTNALVTKYCGTCEFNFGGAYYSDLDEHKALGHDISVVVKGSSTGVNGVHTLKCIRCDETDTIAHNFQEDANQTASDATCVKPGETYYICACNQPKTEYGTLNPNNHVNTEIRGDYDAECEKPGYSGDTYCKDCGEKIATGSATPALTHTYTDYKYNDNATCFANGTETATCDLCGVKTHTQEAADTKLTHVYNDEDYKYNDDAKCGVDGTETATCAHGCGTENTRTAENTALEHNFNGTYVSNNNGKHVQKCTNAGCTETGNEQSCTYGDWTTDNEATHSHTCTDCEYTPAAQAHVWSKWDEAEDNTDAAEGKQTRTCEICGRVETTDCSYTFVETPATCTKDAFTTYTCSDCGHGYTVIEPNTATGHEFTGAYKYDADTDKHQQLCANDCGAYGVGETAGEWADCEWTYANKEAGKHTATCECGNSEEQACEGGQATCTAQAVCQYCGEAYGEKADHNYTGSEKYLHKATDATCIANETYYYYCIGCEQTAEGVGTYEKPDTMTAHDYTCTDEYLYIATEAQCGVNETYYAYCSNPDCKKSSENANNTFEKEGTALAHNFGGTAVCNNDGTHTLTCQNSNNDGWVCEETNDYNCTDTEELVAVNGATCTEAGYNEYKCKLCDYEWEVETEAALGHEYTEKIYDADHLKSDANCTTPKIYWYDCKWCDKNAKDETDTETYTVLKYESGDIREHKWINEVADKYLATPATCFAAAKYYKSCEYEDCGIKHTSNETFSSGAPLDHDWKEVRVDKYLATSADCITDATYYYECSACKNSSKDYGDGETWTDVDSKSGHELEHTAAKAADCYNAGNLEYWYCSTCKKYFKDKDATEAFTGESATVIKKRDHDIEKFAFKAATCEEDGHPAYEVCKYEDCEYTTYPAELPDGYKKTGHNFTGAYYCDEVNGYHSKLCLNECGASGMVVDGEQVKYTVEYGGLDNVITGGEKCDFTGEYVNSTDEDGIHSHALKCVCGNTTSAVCVDAEPAVIDPTCTEDGYTLHICDVCAYDWKTDITTAPGHDLADTATSNGDGTHSVKCSKCDYAEAAQKCSGGTATCKDQAICEVCKSAYGEKGDHVLADDGWKFIEGSAACGVDGKEKQTCSACGEDIERTAAGTALEHVIHVFADADAVKVFNMSGEHTGYNKAYGYVVPEKFADLGLDVKAPTCKEDGLAITYCDNCNYYKTMTVAKDSSAHEWPEEGTAVGDCATGITIIKTCKICGATKTEPGESKHIWDANVIVKGTCAENGYIIYECAQCGFVKTLDENVVDFTQDEVEFEGMTVDITELKAKGHEWGETIITKEPTCSQKGRGYQVCANCLGQQDVEISVIAGAHDRENYGKDGCNLKKVAAVAPTCNASGHKEYYECTRCSYSEYVNDKGSYYIAPTGHADNNGDGKCDACKTDVTNTSNCGCICHKESGFMKFIYKIFNFFWKLFKINKSCACGNVHY